MKVVRTILVTTFTLLLVSGAVGTVIGQTCGTARPKAYSGGVFSGNRASCGVSCDQASCSGACGNKVSCSESCCHGTPCKGTNCNSGCNCKNASVSRSACRHGCQDNCNHGCRFGQYCRQCQSQPGARPMLRQAFRPSNEPYFGVQPLIAPRNAYAPHARLTGYPAIEASYPKGGNVFPGLRQILTPDQCFMSTKPLPPMPTYTTRGPRDFFLNDNPSSIGY